MPSSIKDLAVKYGATGVTIYLLSTVLVYVVFWVALQFGWSPDSLAGNTGYWIAAYATAKATQIPRIAVTVFVTPFVSRAYDRVMRRQPSAS